MTRFFKIFLNEWLIVTAIMLNSVLLFLMGFEQLHDYQLLNVIDHGFTIFFILEIISKVSLNSWKNYIASAWNKFDFVLVLISIPSVFELFIEIPDISYLLVFRLLRVMRMLRFMRFIPNISKMIAGIVRAVRASIFIIVALVIYNVLLAVLSSYMFRDEAPEFFSNPLISLNSIFQIFTLEGWYEIADAVIANGEHSSWFPAFTRIFFAFVVLTGGIFGMSIVNAVFVDEMVMDNNDHLEEKVDALNTKIDQLMAERGLSNQLPPSES